MAVSKFNNSRGFTLIELIAVIAIIGIIAAIAFPRISGYIVRAQIATDQATVSILNTMTPIARLNLSAPDPFKNENKSSNELIDFLVDERYLSSKVIPQSKDTTFAWLMDDERWYLLLGESFHTVASTDGVSSGSGGWSGFLTGSYTGSSKNIVLPKSIGDELITQIHQDVFRGKGLISVSFANNSEINRIHARAFQNNDLTTVVLPNSLTRIDTRAFYDNPILTVEIPNNVTTIENKAFNNLTEIKVGSNLTNISNGAINGSNTFREAYLSESGGAGTYIWDEENWVKQSG